MKFRTNTGDGLLLLQHKADSAIGDYLAIAIEKGHVVVSYNLGKQGMKNLLFITSQERVDDGQWHTLLFSR